MPPPKGPPQTEFNRRFNELLDRFNITNKAAGKVGGLDHSTISHWRHDTRSVDVVALAKIVAWLRDAHQPDLTVDYLIAVPDARGIREIPTMEEMRRLSAFLAASASVLRKLGMLYTDDDDDATKT